MDITLDTSAPPEPAYVLEVARALAESARVLAHLTRHAEALGEPPDADRLVRELSSCAGRLPQVLSQVSRHLSRDGGEGRIGVVSGQYAGRPDAAVTALWQHLDAASAVLMRAASELDAAAEITSAMAATEEAGND